MNRVDKRRTAWSGLNAELGFGYTLSGPREATGVVRGPVGTAVTMASARGSRFVCARVSKTLSVTAGAGLPIATPSIAGHGVQPYLQFPWSRELGGGWE
jgi:hypothetical protein